MNNTKTIILFIVLLAIGGFVLFGEKDTSIVEEKDFSFKSLFQIKK